MLELLGELLINNVSGYVIITVLFVWFFFHVSKQQFQREDKLMSHNEKYQDILVEVINKIQEQSTIIQEQNKQLDRLRESVDRQAELIGRVASSINGIISETEKVKQQIYELQKKYGKIN